MHFGVKIHHKRVRTCDRSAPRAFFKSRIMASSTCYHHLLLNMKCLVTIGTTSFDRLMAELDANASVVVGILKQAGFTKLTLQIGRGEYTPSHLVELCKSDPSFEFEYFQFTPSLQSHIDESSFVVSHAGK